MSTLYDTDIDYFSDLDEILEAINTDELLINATTGVSRITISNLKKTFVPYSGATSNVNLGSFKLISETTLFDLSDVGGDLPTQDGEVLVWDTALNYFKVSDIVNQTEDRVDILEGDVATLETTVDTNRLYSDQQYLALKAKADSLQVKCNTLQAEVYTDDPILQYGAVEIIGKGYEANDTPIDVSANVVDGSLELEQKGQTVTNLVKNGDFSLGELGTSVWNGAKTLVSKVLTAVGGGSNTNLQLGIAYGTGYYLPANLPVGTQIHIIARVKTNGSASSAGLEFRDVAGGNQTIPIAPIPIDDNYHVISAKIVTTAITVNPYIRIIAGYADSATQAIGSVSFDGNYGVSAYNLTALGLDHITDIDILSKLLPYVDGTKNVGKIGMRFVGKNLFDKSVFPSDGVHADSKFGVELVEGSQSITDYPFYKSFKTTAGYIACKFPVPVGVTVCLSGSKATTYYSGLHDNISRSVANAVGSFTHTKTSVYGYLYFVSTTINMVDLDSFTLNLGSSALPYEPYQEQLTFLPSIGNSLPNGTADSIKTVADGWEHTKRVSTPVSVASGVAVNTTNYPTAKNGGQWVNELTAGGTEIGVVGTDSTTGAGTLRFELATPITTHYDLPIPTSGKTIHRFAGEEKIALYGTGLTFSENVLSVLSAVKFVAGVMTDITSLATITTNTVTFSGVNATDVVYVKVEHSVNRPLGILEHTPAVSNTASRLAAIEAWIAAQEEA